MNGGIQRQLTGSDVPDGAAEGRCYASPSHPPVDPGVASNAPGSANPHDNSRLCGLFMTIVNGTLDESRAAYEEALTVIEERYGR